MTDCSSSKADLVENSKDLPQVPDLADTLNSFTQGPLPSATLTQHPHPPHPQLSRFTVRVSRNNGGGGGFAVKQAVTDYEARLKSLKNNGNGAAVINPFQKLIDTLQRQKQCSEHFDVEDLENKGPGVIVTAQQTEYPLKSSPFLKRSSKKLDLTYY